MRKIIITGGGFHNKGAESMTFIAVDEMHKRFPNHEIYVICDSEYELAKNNEKMFKFKIKQFDNVIPVLRRKNLKHFLYYLIKGYDKSDAKRTNDFFSRVDILLDISGYALGSDWQQCVIENYLYKIDCANYFGIKVYLMPQSFGPFNYNSGEKKKVFNRIKKSLKNAEVICAREQEGYDILTDEIGLTNVIKSYDLVLNNKSLDLNNVYNVIPEFNIPEIEKNSVAIIPNAMTISNDGRNKDKILNLYKEIISELLNRGKNIYIIYHAGMDRDFCRQIYELCSNEKIYFLDNDYNCIEFNSLVKKFDFIIASRFHAVVHSYKNSVPCITLGWAIKYRELHKAVKQDQYVFNIRDDFNGKNILNSIDNMLANYKKESDIIKNALAQIQKNNVFDIIELER